MPFLGLKNGSAEQELCSFFGDLVAPGDIVPSYGGFRGIGTRFSGSVTHYTSNNFGFYDVRSKNTTENQLFDSKEPVPYPDLLEVQLKSFLYFFQMDTTAENRKNEGLYKVFQENFPITDTRNNFVLEFIDDYIDPPRYSIEECLERGLTYSVPLKAKLKLYCTDDEHEDFGVVVQDVYFGTIPYMTERGTFVINGAERVIVSQLHRSPGVFFGQSMHTNGTKLYSARIIPFKGSWIEFATDINNVMYAYIDRKKKLPVTTLLRAIGYEADQQILEDLRNGGRGEGHEGQPQEGRRAQARGAHALDLGRGLRRRGYGRGGLHPAQQRHRGPRNGSLAVTHPSDYRKRRQDDSAPQGEPLGDRLLHYLQYPAERPL